MAGETPSTPNPEGKVLSEEEARGLIKEYSDGDKPSGDATKTGEAAGSGDSSSPEHTLTDEKVKTIKEAMGRTALIATGLSEEDKSNARIEVVGQKTNQTFEKHSALKGITLVPVVGYIVGSAIKIGIAAKHRHDFNKAVAGSDTLEEAYGKVGLDISESKVLNSSSEQTKERAWQTLENAGYSDDHQIDVAKSRLDQNEKVEKMDDKTDKAVKKALNEYYTALKEGGNQEELSRKFDEQIKEAFAGRENLGVSIDLQQQKTGIETLAKNEDIVKEDVEAYLDKHVSLYRADMKEGVYTKNKVDKVTDVVGAVAAAGVVGGVVAFVAGREGRSELRAATNAATAGLAGNAALRGGLTGAAIGGTFGGIRGWQRAGSRLSSAEIKAATTFDEAAPEATKTPSKEASEASPVVDDDMILDEPVAPDQPKVPYDADEEAWLKWGDEQKEYEEKLKKYKELATEPVAPDQPKVPYDVDEEAWLKWGDEQKAYEEKLAKHKEFLRLRAERDQAQEPVESTENPDEVAEAEASKSDNNPEKKRQRTRILERIARFKRKLTHEEALFAEIEEKRDRKNASDLTKELEELMEDDSPEAKSKLLILYAEIIARGRFSSEKSIDLIKYKDNDRATLEATLHSAESKLGFDVDEAFNNEESDLNKAIKEQYNKLNDNYEEARKKEIEYKVRSAAVDAVTGAMVGAVAGVLFVKLMATETAQAVKHTVGEALGLTSNEGQIDPEQLDGDQVELVEDPDGGYTVKIGDQEIIGAGEAKGIDFNSDGTFNDESVEMLKAAGFDIKDIPIQHHLESSVEHVNIDKYLLDNKEASNVIEVSDRTWIPGNNGHDQIMMGNTHLDTEGNIVIHVETSSGSNETLDGMQLLLTPGNGNIETGITVDIDSNGNIEIPANSPAASFFDGTTFKGGYGEIIREGANGHIDVYSTPFINRGSGITSIAVPSSEAVFEEHNYVLTAGDREFNVTVPEEVVNSARFEAINDLEPIKGVAGPIYYEELDGTTQVTTPSGEVVELHRYEHHGGYSETYDSFFGEKGAANYSGVSIPRQVLGDAAEGLDEREVSALFFEKLNSGEIQESDYIEACMKDICNSPEKLTFYSALLGDFKVDINGDGVPDLIDTTDEINIAADIISRDPEVYDLVANDFQTRFHEACAGGQVIFHDLSQPGHTVEYMTYATLDNDHNVIQHVGYGSSTSYGVAVEFVKADGKTTIYNEEVANNLLHVGKGQGMHIISKGNCGNQAGGLEETTKVQPEHTKTESEKTESEKTESEKTESEKTESEKTESEKTESEKTESEKTESEKTESEKTESEKTESEKTESEKTESEKTESEDTDIEPKDEENLIRIDDNIDNDIEDNIGTEDIHHHTDLGTGDQTDQPSDSDYQGTEPTIVEHSGADDATPVQHEDVSSSNDYSSNQGGAHEDAYKPVQSDTSGQGAADNSASTPPPHSDVSSSSDAEAKDDALEEYGIN